MGKILIVVDPQNDFISGSLTVYSANDKMINLSEHLKINNKEYDKIFITCDWHPSNHVSFGTWVKHCIQHTNGAAVFEPLLNTIIKQNINYEILTKGDNPFLEEYSIMKNTKSKDILKHYLDFNAKKIDTIDICGIAGDFCVISTIKDLVSEGYGNKVCVLKDYVASISEENFEKELKETLA